MSDFSWKYVGHIAHDAIVDLGRVIAATIAEAVDPGLYVVEPDTVYEVRVVDGARSATRNGVAIAGPGAAPSEEILIAVASEMAGTATTIEVHNSLEINFAR